MKFSYMFLLFSLLIEGEVARATPLDFEIWFLSPMSAKVTKQKKLNYKRPIQYVENNQKLLCQRMGDYCFDPQQGVYSYEKSMSETAIPMYEDANILSPSMEELREKGSKHHYVSAIETDMIKCDANYYFDLFCGKAKKESTHSSSFEVWIDISSSLREFDPAIENHSCYRKSFVKRILDKCGQDKVTVSVFDTSIRTMGGLDTLCIAHGLNDQKRLMKWIEDSKAKKLIIITDIDEYTQDLEDFIKKHKGRMKGEEVKAPLTGNMMADSADDVAKICIKK